MENSKLFLVTAAILFCAVGTAFSQNVASPNNTDTLPHEIILNVIECGNNFARTITIRGTDTIVKYFYSDDIEFEIDDVDYFALYQDTVIHNVFDVETLPKFPGGIDSMETFLHQYLQYPQDIDKTKIKGVVLVGFVVEKDGSITRPVVKTTLCPSCVKEAMRVIMLMPKWEPASIQSIPVRSYWDVPIRFDFQQNAR